jgi:hypothetical protein
MVKPKRACFYQPRSASAAAWRDVDEPFDWFGTMQIKFRGAKAYYIAILTGDTQ